MIYKYSKVLYLKNEFYFIIAYDFFKLIHEFFMLLINLYFFCFIISSIFNILSIVVTYFKLI